MLYWELKSNCVEIYAMFAIFGDLNQWYGMEDRIVADIFLRQNDETVHMVGYPLKEACFWAHTSPVQYDVNAVMLVTIYFYNKGCRRI